jgi:hypothetical protein
MGVDPVTLLSLTTVNLAIGNTDAHAKNISVIHAEDGSHRLAPAYDVAMNLHRRHADPRFAMDPADGGRRAGVRATTGCARPEGGHPRGTPSGGRFAPGDRGTPDARADRQLRLGRELGTPLHEDERIWLESDQSAAGPDAPGPTGT